MQPLTSFHARFDARQGGAAAIGITFLLLLLISGALAALFGVTGSVTYDAAGTHHRVQALFLAESGMERATQRFLTNGVACQTLGEQVAMGSLGTFTISTFTQSGGTSLDFSGTPVTDGSCRVRVAANAGGGGVLRVIEAMVSPSGQALATQGSSTFTCHVPPGSELLLHVSVSLQSNTNNTAFPSGVTFGGTAMTAVNGGTSRSDDRHVAVRQFFLLNPPVGTASGLVTLTDSVNELAVACLVLTGVDQTFPIDVQNVRDGLASVELPNINLTTGAANENGMVVDAVARRKQGSFSMVVPSPNVPERASYFATNPGGWVGAGSYRGPYAGGSNVAMNWDWNTNAWEWAISGVVFRSSAGVGGGATRRVQLAGGGIRAWREVIASAP